MGDRENDYFGRSRKERADPPVAVSEEVEVKTSTSGVRTVKASDIIESESGKAGLAKSKALFERVGGRRTQDHPAYPSRTKDPPVAASEPVAWQAQFLGGSWYNVLKYEMEHYQDHPDYEHRALYTHPVESKEAREVLEETTGWAMVSEYTNERRWYFQAGDERPSHLWERAKLLVALATQEPSTTLTGRLQR